MPEAASDLAGRLTCWAQRRLLGPVSVTGISLALSVCAAGWLSGSTAADSLFGGLALLACYLTWRGARRLARPDAAAADAPAGRDRAGAEPAGRAVAALITTTALVSTCVSYAGLAAGGEASRLSGTWQLATAAMIVMAAHDIAGACRGGVAGAPDLGSPLSRAVRAALAFPFGGRVTVIAVAAPIWGPRTTLLFLLEWAVVATAYRLTAPRPRRAVRPVADSPDAQYADAQYADAQYADAHYANAHYANAHYANAQYADAQYPDARYGDAQYTADPAAGIAVPVDAAPLDALAALADGPVPADATVEGRVLARDAAAMNGAVPVDTEMAAGSAAPAERAERSAVGGVARSDAVAADGGVPVDAAAAGGGLAAVMPAAPGAVAQLDLMIHAGPQERHERGDAHPADPGSAAVPAGPGSVAVPMGPGSVVVPVDAGSVGVQTDPGSVAVPADPGSTAITLACRDDGAVALRLGRAVRGQFVPLPPALAGLAATSLLAWLGMRNLPGLLLLTPLVVMLLAAFGSAHPHDRALDWLTPAVLVAGQLEYAAAVGFAFRVPPPLTFMLCGLILLRHVSMATGDQRSAPRGAGARLGWEGRMLIIGLGAMLGVATLAYVALAALMAVLVVGGVLPRYTGFAAQGARLG